jgi:hypothetical protein
MPLCALQRRTPFSHMTTYVWSLTSEEQESANATRWARANNATSIPTSSIRRRSFLQNSANGDILVIVAHGSDEALGTSGNAVSYSPTELATMLVTTLGLQDHVRVVLAACSSSQFATALQTAIRTQLANVTCEGQVGDFSFGETFTV